MNRHRHHNYVFNGLVALGVVIILALGIFYVSTAYQIKSYSNCKVEDKDRTRNSDGGSDARVYTSCGVFQVADSLVRGEFNSADTYSKIKVGQTYDFEAQGPRVGILSMFPNILEVK